MAKKNNYASARSDEFKKTEEKRNEVLTNRLMFVFAVSVVLVTAVIMITGGNISYTSGIYYLDIIYVMMYIFAACTAASLVYFIIARKNKKDEQLVTFSSKLLLGMSLFAFLVFLLFALKGATFNGIVISLIISAIILYFVFYLYTKEFFLFSSAVAVACYCVFFCRSKSALAPLSLSLKVLLVAFPLFILLYFFILRKPKGILSYFKFKSKKVNILPMLLLTVLCVLCAVVLFISIDFIFYEILVMLAFYLIIGVVYTIKLI